MKLKNCDILFLWYYKTIDFTTNQNFANKVPSIAKKKN